MTNLRGFEAKSPGSHRHPAEQGVGFRQVEAGGDETGAEPGEPFAAGALLGVGQRMEQINGEKALKISQFSEYRAIVGQSIANTEDKAPVDTLRSIKLIRDPIPANLGELSWRLGLGIAAFNLVLLALVLSATNPRSGRGYSLMFSLLAFVVYYNLLNIGASWLGGARLGFAPFMLGLHGSVLVATLLWLAYRHNQWSWRHLLTLRSPANAL